MNYPVDLQIRILDATEWARIAETYTAVFANGMPTNPAQSLFYGVFAGKNLIGFAHLESMFHLNCIYLEPEHRKAKLFDAVFKTMDAAIPETMPVIILPDKRVHRLLKSYDYRNLGTMEVWRKDY